MSNKNEINFPINPNTKKLLNDSFFYIPATEEERNTKENEAIIALLDNYTRLKRKNYLKKFLTNLILDKQMNINFDDITYNEITKMYEVHLKNGNIITFDILSNQALDKEIIKELNSIKRVGKCHTRSIQLSNDIKDSSVLTGYYITTKNKIFHSVVETIEDGKSYILDWTMGIKMPKEQYIDLYKFQVLQRISSNDLKSDMDIMKKIDFQGLKTYLAFRDELMKDLEKNKQLFEDNFSSKRK